MSTQSIFILGPFAAAFVFVNSFASAEQINFSSQNNTAIEEVHVWGKTMDRSAAGYTNPTSIITPEDMASINIATTEDIVKFEPSLVIRRRFIGDANGTMGIRGANMFQTSRSMVFADGVPLHYFLQSRWNGAPRWNMVSASEIALVEVIYGPFSAEYSGNAMAGVVLIETALPQQQEFHADGTFFSQDFDAYGFSDTLNGYKGFLSYGNKIENVSFYASYNHLENKAQPQTYYYGGNAKSDTPTPVTGMIRNNDELSVPRTYYGDTGVVDTTTDNIKLKLGYDVDHWQTLLNIAYEDRNTLNSPNAYAHAQDGSIIWSGDVSEDGIAINIPFSRLNISELQRESLSIGLRVKGEISQYTQLQANISQFDILRDQTATSERNPADPAYNLSGQVGNLDGSGWQTAEIKIRFSGFSVNGLDIVSGWRYETYTLQNSIYSSTDYTNAVQSNLIDTNGGKTQISALFLQGNWQLNNLWDISLGGRLESFKSYDGYFANNKATTLALDIDTTPNTSSTKFSPKFSVGYRANEKWLSRYSVARAYRFPIVEELFSQYQAYNAISESNPELVPENGLHHNFMFDYNFEKGYARINVFTETIESAIESQSTTIESGVNAGVSVRTFVPIDKIKTDGIEWLLNRENIFQILDLRVNLTYINSKIKSNKTAENAPDFDPINSIEGNDYPRMPKWRGNLLTTFHCTDQLDASINFQYASDSYGRLDNKDEETKVYGAQDGYARWGAKLDYHLSARLKLGLGIDNITNNIAYVAHPWPQRTLYLNFSYDM